jgi:hypothetical protein
MKGFEAKILNIGVNPYVLLPEKVLATIFKQAKKDKGPIAVCGTINKNPFLQTLVKYSGKWRLYLNTPMRTSSGTRVGDTVTISLRYDPRPRVIPVHPKLQRALQNNLRAKKAFDALAPSRKKEIVRYIGFLKSEEAVDENVKKALALLLGKGRFVGRD